MSASPTQPKTPDDDADGLVITPDDLLQGAPRKALASLCVGFFLFICAGGGLWDLLDPAPAPYATGGERAQEDHRRNRARILDGSKMAVWTGDHQAVSNVRATLVPWYVAILVRFLGEANEEMLVGKDAWIFRWDRLNPGPEPNDPRAPELAARVLQAVERRMTSLDLELLLLPLPRKGVIAAEYLPEGIDPFSTFDSTVLARLAQWGVPHINLLEVFEGKTARELWYTQDTHWRQLAQLLAAEAVQEHWQLGPAPGQRAAKITPSPLALPRRTMLLSLGLEMSHPATNILPPEPGERFTLHKRNAKDKKWKLPPPVEQPAWAVVGTSFTAGDLLVQLLANNLGSTPMDASERGAKTIDSLAGRLVRYADSLPPRWLLEVPIYQLFYNLTKDGQMQVGPEVFSFFRQTAHVPVQVLDKRLSRKDTDNNLLLLAPGLLVHDGDGALMLRLQTRHAPKDKLTLYLRQGEMHYTLSWPAGDKQVDIPLLANGRTDSALRLDCQEPEELGHVRIEIVTEYDLAGGLLMTPSVPTADKLPNSWTQEMLFDQPLELDRHHALWLKTQGIRNSVIHIELLPAESAPTEGPRELGLAHVRPKSQAIIYAGGPGGPFRGVRLSGPGPIPEQTGELRLVALPKGD